MAIATDSLPPTCLPLVADWVAAVVAAASETSVAAAAIVASAPIAVVATIDSIITAANATAVNAALPGNKNKSCSRGVYAKTTVESEGDGVFIHNDTPECQVLWEMATESVFELADKLDDSDNKK